MRRFRSRGRFLVVRVLQETPPQQQLSKQSLMLLLLFATAAAAAEIPARKRLKSFECHGQIVKYSGTLPDDQRGIPEDLEGACVRSSAGRHWCYPRMSELNDWCNRRQVSAPHNSSLTYIERITLY